MYKHNQLVYSYTDGSGYSYEKLQKVADQYDLLEYIKTVADAVQLQYQTVYASVALPDDQEIFEQIQQVVSQKKALHPSFIIVIGIGGSSLGAKAVYQALRGSFIEQSSEYPKLYFLETLDADYTYRLLTLIEDTLKKGEKVVVNVITKSGTTTETLVNFEKVLNVFKRWYPQDYHEFVVVTTDSYSPLHQRAEKEQFVCLQIPKLVGGRFSVFSAVGLFPLLLVGIDCNALLQGARDILQNSLSTDLMNNQSAQSALVLYLNYEQGCIVHDTFLFSNDLEGLGKWYRQLMGESIGKEYDIQGDRVCVGIIPTVSMGTNDLHSVAQLYLSGIKTISTSFVSVALPQETATSYATMMNAFIDGTKIAYQKNNMPFSYLVLPQKNAYYIGQFMQYKMVEIILLGYLLNINPFDQPNVELYKKEVVQLLIS